jgi:hypothetical protein
MTRKSRKTNNLERLIRCDRINRFSLGAALLRRRFFNHGDGLIHRLGAVAGGAATIARSYTI